MSPEDMRKDVLIIDIETYSSNYDIKTDFDAYVNDAKIKWFGCYSYLSEKYYEIPVAGNEQLIYNFIKKHRTIIGFNSEEFDITVIKNNNLWPEGFFRDIDVMKVLGNGIGMKGRGGLMGYKFRKNSLKEMAKAMELPVQKGDIDYKIFAKDSWTEEEEKEIRKYLRADVEVTKLMFDKLFDFWLPFTTFINEKNVKNWSWIKSKIAALVYKYACHIMGWDEEYGEKGGKTDGGGRVIEPKEEEAWDVWYVDVRSLYPHIYALFNLLSEVSSSEAHLPSVFHGNEVFKVKGYYDISKPHPLCIDMMKKLKHRIAIKKADPDNPLAYAYKIALNTIYGANRSTVFTNLHTPNSGEDCCYIGRQIHHIMEEKMAEKGYRTIAGDTDGCMMKHPEKKTHEQVRADLKDVVEYILSHTPFPQETFDIEIEDFIHYIMYVSSEEKGKTLKKNYAYVYEKKGVKKVKVMGLPIKKVNATLLGPMIFKKYIEPRMIEELKGKFDRIWVEDIIKKELDENMEMMAQEYRCNNYKSYSFKGKRCLTAQISQKYMDGKEGIISLIKNKKIGQVGSSFKYCTLAEAKERGLRPEDIDLTKVYNELSPFVAGGLQYKKSGRIKRDIGPGFFSDTTTGIQTELKVEKAGFF